MQGLLLKLQNFTKVKLIFGHPVLPQIYKNNSFKLQEECKDALQ